MKKQFSLTGCVRLTACISVLLVLFALICGVGLSGNHHNMRPQDHMQPSDGWVLLTDGGTEAVSLPETIEARAGESYTLQRSFSPPEMGGCVLLFRNYRATVTVSAGDEVLYTLNSSGLSRMIRCAGLSMVHLPHTDADTTVTVTFSLPEAQVLTLPVILTGSGFAATAYLLRHDLATAVSLMLIVVLAFLLLVGSIMLRIRGIREERLSALFFFLILIGCWGFTDSTLINLTGIRPEFLGLVCYFSLMLMPVPITWFGRVTFGENTGLMPVYELICLVNAGLQAVLSLCGIIQLQQLLLVDHLLVFVIIILGLRVSHRAATAADASPEIRTFYHGFVLLGVCGIITLACYWGLDGEAYRTPFLVGMDLYYITLMLVLVRAYTETVREGERTSAELNIYRRVSSEDTLTGLKNRRSFDAALGEIAEKPEDTADAILFMMDLNGLKYTNDTLGHAAGDDLICAAARCISAVFSGEGSCYRIGGDEFTALIRNPAPSAEHYIRALQAEIDKYNAGSDSKLSLAVGASHLLSSTGQRLTISNWKQDADIRMYMHKTSFKEDRSRGLTDELREIILCIVATVEAKDIYTADHSSRVRELSVMLGGKLGLTPSTLEELSVAAQLHDIGKIGVPDQVLTKPGRLSAEEYRIMQQHPVLGAQIVARSERMQEISDIILHHHERWDGRGYPDSLAGEVIPLGARIIALADSIDAMTSNRCYRKALNLDVCRREIEKNLGIMYDPAIGRILLENWSLVEDLILTHPKHLINSTVPTGEGAPAEDIMKALDSIAPAAGTAGTEKA